MILENSPSADCSFTYAEFSPLKSYMGILRRVLNKCLLLVKK